MIYEQLSVIIEKHKKWLNKEDGGERAVLCGAVLRGANLYGANLRGANLYGANLYGANLYSADLRKVDLCDADLCGAVLGDANLRDANLRDAGLCGADMRRANLCGANLWNADLWNADLRGANLCGADLRGADLRGSVLRDAFLCDAINVPFIPMVCPESGSFTAWKKANGYIVKLLIPEDARRSSSTGRKCRCDKAVVVAIETVNGKPARIDEIASGFDGTFIYRVGETVTVPNFCEDRFQECAAGIHFFINRQEAVNY